MLETAVAPGGIVARDGASIRIIEHQYARFSRVTKRPEPHTTRGARPLSQVH